MTRSATGRPIVAALAGLAVGVAAVVGLSRSGWPQHDRPAAVVADPAVDAEHFVAQWRRMRLATWVLDARFVRLTRTGQRLETTVHMAQRPPDRLVTGLGSIAARRGGVLLACAPDAAGSVHCRDGGAAPPYEEDVARDLDSLRRYVIGSRALYRVTQAHDCYTLQLRVRILTPPYGRRATFCFDPGTDAPVRSEVVRVEATDRTVATRVAGRPTDADLDPEQWGGGGRG